MTPAIKKPSLLRGKRRALLSINHPPARDGAHAFRPAQREQRTRPAHFRDERERAACGCYFTSSPSDARASSGSSTSCAASSASSGSGDGESSAGCRFGRRSVVAVTHTPPFFLRVCACARGREWRRPPPSPADNKDKGNEK